MTPFCKKYNLSENTKSEPKEKKAYKIASEHLGMSYQTDKSLGFLEWKKKNYPL